MSDSDETVCGNESGEENTQGSPSILSDWNLEKARIHLSEKGENSPKMVLAEKDEETRYQRLSIERYRESC